jgi:hypothetical protein
MADSVEKGTNYKTLLQQCAVKLLLMTQLLHMMRAVIIDCSLLSVVRSSRVNPYRAKLAFAESGKKVTSIFSNNMNKSGIKKRKMKYNAWECCYIPIVQTMKLTKLGINSKVFKVIKDNCFQCKMGFATCAF